MTSFLKILKLWLPQLQSLFRQIEYEIQFKKSEFCLFQIFLLSCEWFRFVNLKEGARKEVSKMSLRSF